MQSEMNILKILLSSGPVVQGVLVLLVFASIISWAIIFKKKKLLKQVKDNNKKFLDLYLNSGNLKEVMDSCDSLPFSPYREMFKEGYSELSKIKASLKSVDQNLPLDSHFKNFGLGVLERSLSKGVNTANIILEEKLSTLASIGSITPFVGLFGTVWGIINSFQGLAGGGATIDAVAPGIAEALVATAVGLAAAIPAVWYYNHFSGVNSVFNSEMENFGQEFLNVVERSILVGKGS